MSEAASTRVALAKSTTSRKTTRRHPASTGTTALLPSLAPLLHEWVPRQRWFAGKGQPVTGFSLVAATEILPLDAAGTGPGLLHLLVRVHQPSARPAQSQGDCYQLLLGVRTALPQRLAAARIGQVTEGPLAGRTLYEGLHDPASPTFCWNDSVTPDPSAPSTSTGPVRSRRGSPRGSWTPSSPTPLWCTATRSS